MSLLCVCVCVCYIVRMSLSKPPTSGTALCKCVCIFVCLWLHTVGYNAIVLSQWRAAARVQHQHERDPQITHMANLVFIQLAMNHQQAAHRQYKLRTAVEATSGKDHALTTHKSIRDSGHVWSHTASHRQLTWLAAICRTWSPVYLEHESLAMPCEILLFTLTLTADSDKFHCCTWFVCH